MKKLSSNSLRRFKESCATDIGVEELRNEKELIRKFDEWIASKAYYRVDTAMHQVAERLGVTRGELSWVCRRVYGDNFLSLRRRLRLGDASRLIAEYPELPFSVIAERVGIPDKTNFRRQFFSEFGMSPGEWREKHRR